MKRRSFLGSVLSLLTFGLFGKVNAEPVKQEFMGKKWVVTTTTFQLPSGDPISSEVYMFADPKFIGKSFEMTDEMIVAMCGFLKEPADVNDKSA